MTEELKKFLSGALKRIKPKNYLIIITLYEVIKSVKYIPIPSTSLKVLVYCSESVVVIAVKFVL